MTLAIVRSLTSYCGGMAHRPKEAALPQPYSGPRGAEPSE